jgi:5-hydroxyisourate hydrolase-like protein (transthyretin family)
MTMRILKQLVFLALVLFLTVPIGYATTLVVQKEISVSRALTGHVLVRATDEPASGVIVELCSADWKTVLKSTKTDEKGHFELEQPATGKLFYIRVSAPGMDIYELRARIKKRAAKELTIRLSIAT